MTYEFKYLFIAKQKITGVTSLVFGLVLFCLNIQAQPGFSQWHDFGSGAKFYNVLLKEDTLIIAGANLDTDANQWGALFVKMDTLGNIIDSKLHIDSLGGQYAFRDGYPLISTSDGGYLIAGDVLDRSSDFIMKLDANGNQLFFKEFPYPSNVFFGLFSKIIEFNDGFLIAGFRQLENFKNDWYLMKTDLEGNVEWEKYYGVVTLDEGLRNFVQIDSDQFVLTGSKELYLPPYNDPDFISAWMVGINGEGETL